MKAIVLLSGGQDSTTCLFWALQRFEEVEAVGFSYGQTHSKELIQAGVIADIARVKYTIFNLKGLLENSSLVNGTDHNTASPLNKDLPASFTAGRNILFLTVAGSYGANKGITNLVTGVCQTDYSGYPDCRRETIDAIELSLSLGIGMEFKIHTPLMYLNKAETWKLARDLGCLNIIVRHTLTDYNGDMTENDWGYGKEDNPASILRAKGFREAKALGWI